MSGGRDWEPERVVTAAEAAKLVAERFPQLRGAPVTRLATGWDNTAFIVGDDWVFRFPRREIAVPGVEREIAVLPALAPRLPLPVPVPSLAAGPSAAFPWPFWGARMIPGTELADAGLAEEARVRAAGAAGEFLRALHAPGLVDEIGSGLPHDPMRRAAPAVRARLARERLDRLAERGVWEPDPAVRCFLAEADGLIEPTGTAVVSHGDLHVRHLLVDDVEGEGAGARAVGVIDWGDLCLADPAVDLSLAYGCFSGAARSAFQAAYGPVDGQQEMAARVLALFLCAALAEYASSSGRGRLLAEAISGIGRAVHD